MTDKIWQRHSNPWSVLTHFTCLPLISAGIWSREWLEWWSLILIGLAFFWAWYNPIKEWKTDTPRWSGSSPSINKLAKKGGKMSDTEVLDQTFHFILTRMVDTGQAPHAFVCPLTTNLRYTEGSLWSCGKATIGDTGASSTFI